MGKNARKPKTSDQKALTFSRKRTMVGRRGRKVLPYIVVAILALVIAGRVARRLPHERSEQQTAPAPAGSALSFEDIQAQRLIVDVHEHIESFDLAQTYLDAMDKLGIGMMCLMGSSKFTLTLNEQYGFTQYDENNEELMRIHERYPDRFEAWPTLDPTDREKLNKIKALIARGAQGVKLYIGHGYVTRSGAFLFHPKAMDAPDMLELYAWCEENFVPLCMHVNPFDDGSPKGKPGFAQEFVAVLTQFPDLKVVCPHFLLSSVKTERLRAFLDAFPNLYTDVSFGDFFMKERLRYISKYPKKFRKLFDDYPDRFMYGTDLVLIHGSRQTEQWVLDQGRVYLDMLTKETYTTPIMPDETLNGVNLPERLLDRILYRNYQEFIDKRPHGTNVPPDFDWKKIGVVRVDRQPGQAFPPREKAASQTDDE